MRKNKISYSITSKKEKLRYLRAFEANGMNQSKTARELGIARSTIARYHKKYRSEYVKNKASGFEDSKVKDTKKILLDADMDDNTVKLQKDFLEAFDLMSQRLDNDPSKIPTKDLIQFIRVACPYLFG